MTDDAYAEVALHVRGYQISRMVHVAADLELADRVAAGPRPVADLATEAGAHPEKLLRLCRALAAFGIFSVDEAGRVSQTPKSACLRKDAVPTLHYAARFWGMESTWATWGNIDKTIRTGEAAFEATYGMPNFDYLKQHPEQSQIFDAFMQHSPDDRHAAVANAYDFSDAGLVIDVGGGNGGLLKAILGAFPDVRGELFDQVEVVAGAPAALGSLASRCAISGGSFFERVPEGGDVYTMSQILHDWSDERGLQILANCRKAMRPGARLVIIERVLDADPGKSVAASFLSDMQMMALFPGAKERTLGEFNAMFRQSGMRDGRLIPTRSVFSVIETELA